MSFRRACFAGVVAAVACTPGRPAGRETPYELIELDQPVVRFAEGVVECASEAPVSADHEELSRWVVPVLEQEMLERLDGWLVFVVSGHEGDWHSRMVDLRGRERPGEVLRLEIEVSPWYDQHGQPALGISVRASRRNKDPYSPWRGFSGGCADYWCVGRAGRSIVIDDARRNR